MSRIAIYIFISILFSSYSFAQDAAAPILHCLKVIGDDVQLDWQTVPDTDGTFIEYRVFKLGQAPPLVTFTDPAIFTHTDMTVTASQNSVFYYMEVDYTSPGGTVTYVSDTLETINPINNLFGNPANQSTLIWDDPLMEDTAGMYIEYEVQINYQGAWETRATIPYSDGLYSYDFIMDICHLPDAFVTVDMRILLLDVYGCYSISSVKDGDFIDNNPPVPPLIETVTIDTTSSDAIICWFPSPDGDVGGYNVVSVDNLPVGSTTDLNNLSLLDTRPGSLIPFEREGYYVVAFDSCLQSSIGIGPDYIPHYSIDLNLSFIVCERTTRLDWTPYINWEGGVDYYVVFGGLAGNAMQVLDTVPSSRLFYEDVGVELDVDYSYMVKANSVNGFKPSLSPRVEILTEYPDLPEFTYLSNVSVISDQQIELKAQVEPAAEGTRYRFEKLDRFGEEFDPIVTVDQNTADVDGVITLYDNDVNTSDRIYTYRVSVIDSCGIIASVSDTSYNILLTAVVDNENRTNTIQWQSYRQWEGNILEYRIYRGLDGTIDPVIYDVVSEDRLYYIDDVSSDLDYLLNSTYCYQIEAVEVGDPYGPDQLARSNVACATQDPVMFIPNAIVIGGVNQVFKPVGGYFDRFRFSMEIFDRSGTLMYETDEILKGWDGHVNGTEVQSGIYAYRIRYYSGNGREYQHYGHVTVLKGRSD